MHCAADRVKAAFTLWDDTFDSGNAAALVALYTPDAWLLAGNAPALTGSDHLLGFFNTAFAGGLKDHVLSPFDIIDLGPTLVVQSNWKAQVVKQGLPSTTVGGTATHVLQQQADGSLKLRVHTFNYGPVAAA